MFHGWDKVTPPVRCYMKLCDCRRAAPPVRRVCIGLFHARKMFRHIKAQSVKSSKLVVKSIWNPANVLVFQGFFGIIKIFIILFAGVSAQYLKKLPYSIRLFIRLFSKQSYRIFLIHHVLLVIVIIPRAILYAWHPIFTFIVYFIFCIILSALLSYISKPVALLLKTLLDYWCLIPTIMERTTVG